ncbi:hypothetical protein L596_010450 [Steinernema carpocapsae]|uniref:Uncharacterized protein n=1 Tax=Steinernema carpocapsae TaxID=34508 RepID=A0A4V6A706_STECR|nr:hypothetical protein L596_010450 [Steinernema carpocapsae]
MRFFLIAVFIFVAFSSLAEGTPLLPKPSGLNNPTGNANTQQKIYCCAGFGWPCRWTDCGGVCWLGWMADSYAPCD